ncbi:hypothetical protein ACFQE5_05955 [Pseudonocardia hispaniensis]|uniref:Uncharacterized protein n=1 Tax=Pseudonocardia hispaniensis TaxID=904933 RepID=A0ABW1IZ93_9PSEU
MTKQDMTSRETWSATEWLRRAAEALRRIPDDGPPHRREPDVCGDAGRATVLDEMPRRTVFPAGRPLSTGDPMSAGLRDPMRQFEDAARAARPPVPAFAGWVPIVSPVLAEPLAAMLDSLAEGAERTIRAGGSVTEDPYRSAVDVARLIVEASTVTTATD